VNRTSIHGLVDGIRYQRIGDEHYYAQARVNKKAA
jgi:hypothetical protein